MVHEQLVRLEDYAKMQRMDDSVRQIHQCACGDEFRASWSTNQWQRVVREEIGASEAQAPCSEAFSRSSWPLMK